MKPRLIAIIVVVVVLIVGLLIVSLLLGTMQNNPNGNGNTSSSNQSISTPPNLVGLQNPETAAKYSIVGIKTDDTVVVINAEDKQEIVMSLENKKWLSPRWSPNGKLMAVLGETNAETKVRDIFIYDLEKAEWNQVTNYSATGSGVDSVAWFDDTRLVYTQGASGNRWLHRYDYGNKEIRKEFLTEEIIVAAHQKSQRFIFKKNGASAEFALVGFNGKEIYRFSENLFAQGQSLVNLFAVDGSDAIVVLVKEGERHRSYVWSLTAPDFDEIHYSAFPTITTSQESSTTTSTESTPLQQMVYLPVCVLSEHGIAVIENQINDKLFSLRTLNLQLGDFSDRQSIDVIASQVNASYPKFSAICGDENLLLLVTEQVSADKFESRWYLATIDPLRLQFVELAKDYTDLDVK